MFTVLKQLFGQDKPRDARAVGTATGGSAQPAPQSNDESRSYLELEAAEFLLALQSMEVAYDINEFSRDDRAFMAAILRKQRQNEFEIPVLPEAAIKIKKLLSMPNVAAGDFIGIIQPDPTLSAELLKMANSPYLGFTYPTFDLQQAVSRVGFSQLLGLVTMISLRSRILSSPAFRSEVTWVMELSLAMARVCQQLAAEMETAPEEAFTLGLLHHVDYLVILGEASQYVASHSGTVISRKAVIDSVCRYGSALRTMISGSWGLGDTKLVRMAVSASGEKHLEMSDPAQLSRRLDVVQEILIKAWRHKNPDYDPTESSDCLTAGALSYDGSGFSATAVRNAIAAAID